LGGKEPPPAPADLKVTSAAAGRVVLSWSVPSDRKDVTGYDVYRDGALLGTAGSCTPWFIDVKTAASTAYRYAVDAFDAAGYHSRRSPPRQVRTPARSPAFVQGTAMSPATRQTSLPLSLPGAVGQGDLLVGWFGQYGAVGQVRVSDNLNG